jgi:hypothetical protein
MNRLTISPATPVVTARAFYYGYFYGFRYAG